MRQSDAMPLKRRDMPSLGQYRTPINYPHPWWNAIKEVSILDHVDEDVALGDDTAAKSSHGAALSALDCLPSDDTEVRNEFSSYLNHIDLGSLNQ